VNFFLVMDLTVVLVMLVIKFVEPSASTSQQTDSSLFATTLIPLRLIDAFGNILWNNRTPPSIRFCRLLKLEFIKGTKANILEEEESIRKEIDSLEAFHVKIDENKSVEINCKFLTVIDGKVLNVLTDTKSSQACRFAALHQKTF